DVPTAIPSPSVATDSGMDTSNWRIVFNNGKFGVTDARGTMVLPAQYDNIYPFSNGLAAVQTGGKWAYIDTTGKLVIPALFDDAHSFSEGLAAVVRIAASGQWDYIDTSGKTVIHT